MYKYSTNVEVKESVCECTDLTFHVGFKENVLFELNYCYFIVKKNHDHTFKESDSLVVAYYSENKDLIKAKETIKRAIELFVYMTDIPFDVNNIVSESTGSDRPVIDMLASKKKMEQISRINQGYCRIRTKKELLQKVLQMYAVATKENYLLIENKEDAFFTYFKIIESIVKDDFKVEKNNIDKGTLYTRRYVKQILSKSYNVNTQDNRLDELCGKLSNELFDAVFENIYHKILWFLKRRNISCDKDLISNMVFLRNEIAHGEAVVMDDYLQEYEYIMELTRKVIDAKFFSVNTKIKCRMGF